MRDVPKIAVNLDKVERERVGGLCGQTRSRV